MIFKKQNNEETSWLSLSDMMTVLMVLFLILAVYIAANATKDLNKITRPINNFLRYEEQLCNNLENKLSQNFKKNEIEIKCDPIRIIFVNDKYKFDYNKASLREEFKVALKILFPIYIKTIKNWKTENGTSLISLIDEVRIEGHTDSDGGFISNLKLSQNRSRNVVNHLLDLPNLKNEKIWMQDKLTANGLSYSRRLNTFGEVIIDSDKKNQIEDKDASRRIEIKLRTKAREVIANIRRGNI